MEPATREEARVSRAPGGIVLCSHRGDGWTKVVWKTLLTAE